MLCALVFIFTSGIVLGVLGLSRSVQRPSWLYSNELWNEFSASKLIVFKWTMKWITCTDVQKCTAMYFKRPEYTGECQSCSRGNGQNTKILEGRENDTKMAANAYWTRKALEPRELLSKFIVWNSRLSSKASGSEICNKRLDQTSVQWMHQLCLLSLSGCIRQHFGLRVFLFVFVDGHQVKSFVLFVPQ